MSTVQKRKAKPANPITDEEFKFLIETCEKLTNDQRRDFLKSLRLSWSGNKAELVEKIEEGLRSSTIPLSAFLTELDRILPWWRFHVYLYTFSSVVPEIWRDEQKATTHLASHKLLNLLNAQIPLVLPSELTISSIKYSTDQLRITAVQRRDYTERREELDPSPSLISSILHDRSGSKNSSVSSSQSMADHSAMGDEDVSAIEYRAFVRQVARGLVSFEWDIKSNTAMLQITELPSGSKYETVRDAFLNLISPWFTLNGFQILDVSKAISALHESEKNDEGEIRSHGLEYRTLSGRTLGARSPAISTPVLGEEVIDDSLDRIREEGVGHSGNFYWLPTSEGDGSTPELEREIHVVILGDKNRVSMRTRSTKDVTEREMRHVLSRLRELSQ